MKPTIFHGQIAIIALSAFILVFSFISSDRSDNGYQMLFIFGASVVLLSLIVVTAYHIKDKKEKYVNSSYVKQLANSLDTPAVIWTSDLGMIYINDKLQEMLNVNGTDFIDKEMLLKLFCVTDITPLNIENVVNNKDELIFESDDGETHYVMWSTSLLFSTKKYQLFISVGFDSTKLRKMEKELSVYSQSLSVSEDRYKLSMELSEIGIVLSEKGTEKFYISGELKRILGVHSSIITYESFRHLIHPNDRMLYDTHLKSLFKKSNDKINSLEIRIMSVDNTYHWYLYRYKITDTEYFGHPIAGGAFIDITKDKEKDILIERLAYIDNTTEIPNRNKLMKMGQELFECCNELDFSYWVIVIDIDRFHIINDTCGYDCGDKLLCEFAQMLYKYLSYGGFAARIAGDNFALIMKDYGDNELPIRTIEKIQMDFSKLGVDSIANKQLSCSAGYSKMPGNADCFMESLEQAEFALSAGTKSRGSVIAYDNNMHDMIIDGNEIEKALANAIDNNELELYYQPKIDLTTGKVMGAEALIRWIKPDGTVILPNRFVPVAETSHLITKISSFVLNEACRQNRTWQEMGLPKIVMSINLTSADFYQKDIGETIKDTLIKTGLDPRYLEIELTETLAMQDIDLAVESMLKLRKDGIKLAMDDFGTGYSSLSYIQILPITLLKLDRSFIINLETDPIAQEIVSAVIKIAKSKKIETIAEGIENPGQAKILRKAGCDHAQGYLFGVPMPAEDFITYLSENKSYRKIY